MKIISKLLQTINFKYSYNNLSPFTIEDMYALLKIKRIDLKQFTSNGGDEYVKINYSKGSYPNIEFKKKHIIKKYLLVDEFTYAQKEILSKYDDLDIPFPTSRKEIPKVLEGVVSYTTIKNINRICKQLNIDPYEEVDEKKDYQISTKVGYDITIGKFIFYSSDRIRDLRTNISNENIQYWTKKYSLLANSAAKRNIPFNLNIQDLIELYELQDGKCIYSNLELGISLQKETFTKPETLSIDRINPEKGYVKDNIQMCCNVYNIMKSNMNEKDFIYYINLLNKNTPGLK